MDDKVTERVTENQSLILKGMKKDNQITARILSEIVGISERKIKENIKLLKSKLPPTLSVALKSGKTSDNVLRLA